MNQPETNHMVDDEIEYEVFGLFKIPKIPQGKGGSKMQINHDEWRQMQEEKEAERLDRYYELQMMDDIGY